ncbi:glycosyltransferase family 2 protein [Duganella qianjiadongensis]|uniref:Glycosyltransferase n=1 Tax=Duganella qianjiadongensis TaxID=2692176 RepID=A0ABW9VRT5_9BURK|nr:glycosyltransferase family A protein [Duganella qianjiadongensis]MYM41213.1 glycosyltransferase [Duganella qianjiadongensis]
MTYPKVSIVIPSYKAIHFEACLRSAIGQSYLNTEILVSDNCPTEEIRDICARFPGVIYQRNSVTREDNVLSSLYSGKGVYIKPLFDDDILHPFCIERMVAAMQMDSNTRLVFSATQVINSDNQRTETRRPYEASGNISARDMQRSMALGMRNFVGEFTSIMFRRETLWNIGWKDLFRLGTHDFTRGLSDLVSYINLAKGGNAFYIDEELSYFRHDQRLQSNSNPASNPHFGNCFSDYIDLLVVSHQDDIISRAELLAMDQQVAVITVQLGNVFPQMGQARQRYLDYCAALPADAA